MAAVPRHRPWRDIARSRGKLGSDYIQNASFPDTGLARQPDSRHFIPTVVTPGENYGHWTPCAST